MHCVERISREAAAKLRIPRLETLDGPKPVNLPAGVRSGQTIRVRQLGIPNLDTKKRGDLLVTLDIED